MGYTHLEPGSELEVTCHCYSFDHKNSKNSISDLVTLSLAELIRMEQESIEKEKAIFTRMKEIGGEWSQQAQETLAFRKAQAYLRTPPIKHTSNQLVDKDHNWHEISNTVYKLIWRIYENTRWDKKAEKSVTVSWELSWYLMYNTPNNPDFSGPGQHIAGQDRKRFGTQADMEKYLQGRLKAHAHLFTEISPPIPKDHIKRFCVNGVLLPGYTVEEPMTPDPEKISELLDLLDDDLLAEPSEGQEPQPEEPSPEAVWSKNRKQKTSVNQEKRPPVR